MKIILSGYMGSGKTAVGNALSKKIDQPFKDLDKEIIKKEGRDIREIFETSGEIYFRKVEAEVLQDLIGRPEDFILSLGGGTPCYGNNMQLLQNDPDATVVYLKTSLEELTDRLHFEKEQRPLIAHLENRELLKDFIRKHLFERTYYYNQSNITISTNNKSPEEIAENILEVLN